MNIPDLVWPGPGGLRWGSQPRLDFEHALSPSVVVMSASRLPKTTAGELSRRHRIVVLAICCTSLLVVMMDDVIVSVALSAVLLSTIAERLVAR